MNCNCWCINTGPWAWTRSLEIPRVWLVDVNFRVLHYCGRAKHSRSVPVYKQTNRALLQDIRRQMLHETSKNHTRNSTLSTSLHGLSTIRHTVVLSTHRSQWIIQGGKFPDVRSEGSVCLSAKEQWWRQRYRFDEVRDMTNRLLLSYLLFKVNVKVTLTRQHSHTERSRYTVQLYACWNSTIDCVVFHTAQVTEPPGKNRGTHWIKD